MFDVSTRLPAALKSTVLILGQGTRKDNGRHDQFVLGSGVTVAPEVVLTSNHVNWASGETYSRLDVLVGADDAYVPASNTLYCAPVASFAPDGPRDLLLVRVPGLNSVPVVRRKADPLQGEALFWIGHPGPFAMQMGPVVASGVVAARQEVPHFPRGISTVVRGLRLDGSATSGNSGGGAFDLNGEFSGLICASPLQISGSHLEKLVRTENGSHGEIGGVDVVGVLRELIRELSSSTRPGIAFAVGIEEINSVLPALLKQLK